MNKRRVDSNNGFTLIELAIVIVVLGVLAAVSLPKYLNLTDSAIAAQSKSNAESIQSGYAAYMFQAAAAAPGAPVNPTLPIVAGAPVAASIVKLFSFDQVLGCNFPKQAKFDNLKLAIGAGQVAQTVSTTCVFPYGTNIYTVGFVDESNGAMHFDCTDARGYYCGFTTSATLISTTGVPASLGYLDRQLPLAADKSGVCVANGFKVATWKDPARTTTTTSADLVAAVDAQPLADLVNCPAGTFN